MSQDSTLSAAAGHVHEVRRVTWIGFGINMALFALKLAGGLLGASQAVVADAVHTLSDSTTDVAILIGVRYWTKPPDERHPHGHGRIETLVTTGIGAALAAVAVGLAYNAVATMSEEHTSPPRLIAIIAAAVSIVSKEALYLWTVRVGRRIQSPAVIANAWHHRSDAFSSVPVLLAVGTAYFHPAWYFLDHLGALVVSVFIFRAAALIALPALSELIDAGASESDLDNIRRITLQVPGVRHVHAIRTRYVSSVLHVDLHIMVDGQITVQQGHDIAEAVKRHLITQGPHLEDAVVHLEPYGDEAKVP